MQFIPCKKTKKIDFEKTKKIFTAVGKVITLKQEKQMDIVTAISQVVQFMFFYL